MGQLNLTICQLLILFRRIMAKILGSITNFIGMRRNEDPTVVMPPGYCHLIKNYYKQDGVLKKRTGATKKTTQSALVGKVSSIKQVLFDDGSDSIIISAGSKWYTLGGESSIATAGTVIKSGLVPNMPLDISQFKVSTTTYALLASAITPPKKYDGTTLTDLVTSPPWGTDFNTVSSAFESGGGYDVGHGVVDNAGNYLYLVRHQHGNPTASLDKIDLETSALVDSMELTSLSPVGISDNVVAIAINSSDTFLYILTDNGANPAMIYKIPVDFSTHSTKTLSAGEINPQALAINSTHLYIGLNTTPGKIVKLTLADFSTTSTLTLGSGKNGVYSLAINSTFLYAGTGVGFAARITLSDFSTITYVDATSYGTIMKAIALDSTYLYFALQGTTPCYVIRITLSSMAITSTKQLATNQDTPVRLSVDSSATYLYVALDHFDGVETYTVSAIRLTLSDFTTTAIKQLKSDGSDYPPTFFQVIGDARLYFGAGPGVEGYLTLHVCPKFIETHRSKVWLCGFVTTVERFYARASKTLDATDFTTANDAVTLYLNAVLGVADTFVGIKSWGDYIVMFFTNNILIYSAGTDPNNFQLVKHIKNVGSLSNEVIQVGDDLWFPTLGGIRSLKVTASTGQISFKSITSDIDVFWIANLSTSSTNTNRISMKYDSIRNQIMVLTNDSYSQNTTFYVYSISDKVWTTYDIDGLGADVSVTALEITKSGYILFGTSDGHIYQLFSGTTDNGTAISFVIQPVTQYFGTPVHNKKVKSVRLAIGSGNVTAGAITYDIDGLNIARTTPTIAFSKTGNDGMRYSDPIVIGQRGRSWDFTFTDCGEIRAVTFYGEIQGEK